MRWMDKLRLRLRSLFWRKRIEEELDEEFRYHLESLVEDHVAAGLSQQAAHRAALREMGPVESLKEACRDARGMALVDGLRQDASYAVRALAKNPGFSLVAVLTLGVGIGATTALFSVVRGVLLAPPPFEGADRIVQIVENVPAEESFSGRAMRIPSMNQDEFDWWRRETRTLSHMAAIMPESRTMQAREGTERLAGARVSPALFSMRGVQPLLGRWLHADEERPGSLVVVLSEATWRRYYGSDPNVIDRSIVLDGQVHTIVGVMPASFGDQAFWTPFVVEPPRPGTVALISVVSRLQDGVSLEQAEVEANALGGRLRGIANEPGQPPRFEVVREQDQVVAAVRPALRLLVAAVAVVLLIVCVNVANLLLARGLRRQQELGIRRALGATRLRVVRQLLTESLVLALAGGVVGAVVAYGAVSFVRAWSVIDIPSRFRFALGRLGSTILPRADEIAVDPVVLVFALGLSVVTSVLVGLMPALRASAVDHYVMTGTLTARSGISPAHRRSGHVLAGVQLALATVLLISAGLLIHSFVNLSALPLGFDLDTQVFQLVSPGEYRPSRKLALASDVLDRLRALPGVAAGGFTNTPQPLEADDHQSTIVPSGWPMDRENPDEQYRSETRDVTAGYLPALGVRLVEGRWFDDRDRPGMPRAVIVNRAWVRQFSPDRSPIGTTVIGMCRFLGGACVDSPYEVIGVVEDMRLRMEGGSGTLIGGMPAAERPKTIFRELRQALPPADVLDRPGRMDMGAGSAGGSSGLSFALRTGPVALSLADIRRAIHQVDPQLAVEDLATMGQVFSAITARPRFYATLLAIFGGVAAFIAVIGIYGVLAYSVTRRTHEFGIRLALGATRRQVMRLALSQGAVAVAIGIPCGMVAAAGASRYLAGMLFGITPLDASTYLWIAFGFAVVAMVASYVPARRATRVSPAVALRYE
jgi:predicted permease